MVSEVYVHDLLSLALDRGKICLFFKRAHSNQHIVSMFLVRPDIVNLSWKDVVLSLTINPVNCSFLHFRNIVEEYFF